jgi:CHAT domain-containing protein/tetratricopeptide (TPR) repeat protein
MTSPKKIRTVCAVCAFGLAVLSAGNVPSRGQTPKAPPVPANVNEPMAYRQSIQRALNLANQDKKYVEAIQEAAEAQSTARKAFGPLSEQVDEALHILRQLHGMNRDRAGEIRTLREMLDLRRQRYEAGDWHVRDIEANLAFREWTMSLRDERRTRWIALTQQVNQFDTLRQKSQIDEASEVGRAALKRLREEMPGDTIPVASLLTNLGRNESLRQEFGLARGFFQQALAVLTRLLGEQHPDVANLILTMAQLEERDGDFVRARSLFERALKIRLENTKQAQIRQKEGHPADLLDAELAALLEQVGRLLLQIGDHDGARTQFQRSAEIRRSLADHDRAITRGGGFGMMGRANWDNDFLNPDRRKESPTRRAPSMLGRFDDPMDRLSGIGGFGLGSRGSRRQSMMPGFGAPAPSAMELSHITSEPTHPWSVRERAWMMLRKQRLAGWRAPDTGLDASYLQSLEHAREAMHDESWIAYARCLQNLAVATRARGEREPARRTLLLAVAVGLEATDPSEATMASYAAFLDDFVGLLQEDGELDLAESLAVWSVVYRRASYGERHPEYAAGLTRLAGVLRLRGDRAQAMLLFEKALTIRREVLADNHPDLVEILLPAAEFHHDIGNVEEATRLARRALTISDAFLSRSLPLIPERQRLTMLSLRARAVSVMLDITASRREPDDEIYTHLVPWKGITVLAALAQRASPGTGEVASLRTELARSRDELNRLYYGVVPAAQSQEHGRRARAQVERSAALEARLAEAVGWKPIRIGPPEVQAALPAGSVFIDIYHYQRRGRPALPEGGSPFAAGPAASQGVVAASGSKQANDRAEGHYAAFVVRRGSPPIRVELGPSDPIDRGIRAWLAAIDRDGGDEPTGRQLARAVWFPLASSATDATKVLVSPDGALNFLPWGALPDDRPGSYLLERLAFSVVPSPRQLVSGPGSDEQRPSPGSNGLLAVGGVDYQRRAAIATPVPPENGSADAPVVATRAAPVGTGRAVFSQLPGTLDEVQAVAEVCRKNQAGPVQLLTGTQATKDRLLAAMPGKRYLLLATHGYFAPPEVQSALNPGEAAPGQGWEGMSRRDVVGYHPGLLSGLAWAGASNPTTDPTTGLIDRGAAIMTAEEVAAINLRGCDLAVLSACQTGLGLTAGGEGVLGLQRAFLQAGVRTVVASLWRVDDAATSMLMEEFYANLWVRKLPKLEALRQAQLAVLNNPGLVTKRRAELAKQRGIDEKPDKLPDGGRVARPGDGATRSNPALWAAFVLSGDGR